MIDGIRQELKVPPMSFANDPDLARGFLNFYDTREPGDVALFPGIITILE